MLDIMFSLVQEFVNYVEICTVHPIVIDRNRVSLQADSLFQSLVSAVPNCELDDTNWKEQIRFLLVLG